METSEQSLSILLEEAPFPSATATACPYGLYAAFHRESPVHRLKSGEYVVTRHEDVVHVARHPETFSSRHTVSEGGWMRAATTEDLDRDLPWAIVSSDPPEHTIKRRLAFEMFKPGRLREREPMVRAYADELIDGFIDRGECEFVSEFAELLPAKVILTLFGLPLDYLPRALSWGRYEGFGTRFASHHSQAAARESIVDLGAFLRDLVLERVDNPSDDELSLLVQRHREHYGRVNLASLIAAASNLFIGGIITTTHLLSSLMMVLVAHTEQQAIARQGRPQLRRAIEEALRYESPVQMGPRLVLEDTELSGTPIPKGAIVLVVWGAANRDEQVFTDANRFSVERQNVNEHVAFGGGPHFCLGAPLGRMEATIGFERIFARLTNLRFAESRNDFANHPSVIFRGPAELFVEFERADT